MFIFNNKKFMKFAQNNPENWANSIINILETQSEETASVMIAGNTYHHFTRRKDIEKQIYNDKNFDLSGWKDTWEKSLEQVKNLLSSDWTFTNNGAWSQFSIINRKRNQDRRNYKVYFTAKNALDDFQSFVQSLYDLGKRLQTIKTEYNISFKVSTSVISLASHIDSIVIHFSDSNIINEVEKIVYDIANKNNLKYEDRSKYLRTSIGRDSNDTSDTDELSKRFARNVIANKDYVLSLKDDISSLSSFLLNLWQQLDVEGLHRK